MTETQRLIALYDRHGAKNYLPLPIVLKKGRGSHVWDVDGKQYLDFLSCYSALNFGHQNKELMAALTKQMESLALCSRAFHSEELSYFCAELADLCGLDLVLPMNSGAEAVETAVKICRKWGYQSKGIAEDRAKILVFRNNFHGRTVTIVSFSSEPSYRAGFGPFTPGFEFLPFDDLGALEKAIGPDTAGVLLEPIQAEAGILVPKPGFLKGVSEICKRRNVLMMVDEIQTGLGRTGATFCYQHEGVRPDLVILGKSLGGGLLPISAVVGKKETVGVLKPGDHGSTFGGNPLACAVARKVISILKDGAISKRAKELGEQAFSTLRAARLPHVKEIRGQGALIGIELTPESGGARKYCERIAERGVLCKETHTYVIRVAPPLTISSEELAEGLRIIVDVIREFA